MKFSEQVESLVRLGRPRIGFGLAKAEQSTVAGLRRCLPIAEILLVGPKTLGTIDGFEIETSAEPEGRLAELLVNGSVAGIVRGTLEDLPTRKAYEGLTGERYRASAMILEDPHGGEIILGPGSNLDGWTKEERLAEGIAMADFSKQWGRVPRVAVYAAARSNRIDDEYLRSRAGTDEAGRYLRQTVDDAEWIVGQVKERGYSAENCGIDFDKAVAQGFNVHVALNGAVGNQILRAYLVCGGKLVTAKLLGYSHPYEEGSKNEGDFQHHVRWLVAEINRSLQGER